MTGWPFFLVLLTIFFYDDMLKTNLYNHACNYTIWQLKTFFKNLFAYLFSYFFFLFCRFSCLDVFPVTASEQFSNENPILLRPWEHYAFLFRIIYHENQMAFNKVLTIIKCGLRLMQAKTSSHTLLLTTLIAHNTIILQGCPKVLKKVALLLKRVTDFALYSLVDYVHCSKHPSVRTDIVWSLAK